MKYPPILTLVLASATICSNQSSAQEIANSVDDWAVNPGVQGTENWTYGYRDFTADGGAQDYDPTADFIQFAGGAPDGAWNGTTQQWSGNGWDLNTAGAPPWTVLLQETTHPNSEANGGEHWTIRRWTADELTSITPVAIMWHLRKNNGANDGVTGSIHVNGVQIDTNTIPGSDQVGFERTVYANLRPGDTVDLIHSPQGVANRTDGNDASSNWMRVNLTIPPDPLQPDGTPFVPVSADDTDNDDLPDDWEEMFFPGDLTKLDGKNDADNDMDGSPDIEEFGRATDPTDTDSDDDGLTDGVETGDGNFVDANATGTDPNDADSDNDGIDDKDEIDGTGGEATDPNENDSDADGLNDGDEFDRGTGPNDDDSDDDTYLDGDEVAAGWDPLDPESNPGTVIADSMADFSGEQGRLNWTNGYRNFTRDGGELNYDPTEDFIPFTGGDTGGAWDGTTQQWDGAKWDLFQGGGPWTEILREATHPNGTNSPPEEEHWPIRRWVASDLTELTPLALTWHIRETNLNGTGVTGSLHINGVQVDTLALAGGDGVGAIRTFYANVNPGDIIDLAITPWGLDADGHDGSDGSAFWLRIGSYIPPNPMQPDGSPFLPETGQPFQISRVELDLPGKTITVYWPSTDGRVYAVDQSTELNDVWLEEVETLDAAGDETSYEIPLPDPVPDRIFVRVRDVTDLQ